VFLTVLHRLFVSSSDRAAERWREDYRIACIDGLDLHHLYRAMAWLGEELPAKDQDGRTPFAPRCIKAAANSGLVPILLQKSAYRRVEAAGAIF
jgi:hypothetical protein